jgi:hypothetical protein
MFLVGFPFLAAWGVLYQTARKKKGLGPVTPRYHGPLASSHDKRTGQRALVAEAEQRAKYAVDTDQPAYVQRYEEARHRRLARRYGNS